MLHMKYLLLMTIFLLLTCMATSCKLSVSQLLTVSVPFAADYSSGGGFYWTVDESGNVSHGFAMNTYNSTFFGYDLRATIMGTHGVIQPSWNFTFFRDQTNNQLWQTSMAVDPRNSRLAGLDPLTEELQVFKYGLASPFEMIWRRPVSFPYPVYAGTVPLVAIDGDGLVLSALLVLDNGTVGSELCVLSFNISQSSSQPPLCAFEQASGLMVADPIYSSVSNLMLATLWANMSVPQAFFSVLGTGRNNCGKTYMNVPYGPFGYNFVAALDPDLEYLLAPSPGDVPALPRLWRYVETTDGYQEQFLYTDLLNCTFDTVIFTGSFWAPVCVYVNTPNSSSSMMRIYSRSFPAPVTSTWFPSSVYRPSLFGGPTGYTSYFLSPAALWTNTTPSFQTSQLQLWATDDVVPSNTSGPEPAHLLWSQPGVSTGKLGAITSYYAPISITDTSCISFSYSVLDNSSFVEMYGINLCA